MPGTEARLNRAFPCRALRPILDAHAERCELVTHSITLRPILRNARILAPLEQHLDLRGKVIVRSRRQRLVALEHSKHRVHRVQRRELRPRITRRRLADRGIQRRHRARGVSERRRGLAIDFAIVREVRPMVDFATIRETTVPQLDTLTDDEAEAVLDDAGYCVRLLRMRKRTRLVDCSTGSPTVIR